MLSENPRRPREKQGLICGNVVEGETF